MNNLKKIGALALALSLGAAPIQGVNNVYATSISEEASKPQSENGLILTHGITSINGNVYDVEAKINNNLINKPITVVISTGLKAAIDDGTVVIDSDKEDVSEQINDLKTELINIYPSLSLKVEDEEEVSENEEVLYLSFSDIQDIGEGISLNDYIKESINNELISNISGKIAVAEGVNIVSANTDNGNASIESNFIKWDDISVANNESAILKYQVELSDNFKGESLTEIAQVYDEGEVYDLPVIHIENKQDNTEETEETESLEIPSLKLNITPSKKQNINVGDTIKFDVELINNGNVDFKDIVISNLLSGDGSEISLKDSELDEELNVVEENSNEEALTEVSDDKIIETENGLVIEGDEDEEVISNSEDETVDIIDDGEEDEVKEEIVEEDSSEVTLEDEESNVLDNNTLKEEKVLKKGDAIKFSYEYKVLDSDVDFETLTNLVSVNAIAENGGGISLQKSNDIFVKESPDNNKEDDDSIELSLSIVQNSEKEKYQQDSDNIATFDITVTNGSSVAIENIKGHIAQVLINEGVDTVGDVSDLELDFNKLEAGESKQFSYDIELNKDYYNHEKLEVETVIEASYNEKPVSNSVKTQVELIPSQKTNINEPVSGEEEVKQTPGPTEIKADLDGKEDNPGKRVQTGDESQKKNIAIWGTVGILVIAAIGYFVSRKNRKNDDII